MSTQVAASSRTKRTQAEKAAPSARREGHLIGYARVSTTGQDTATQEAKLSNRDSLWRLPERSQ